MTQVSHLSWAVVAHCMQHRRAGRPELWATRNPLSLLVPGPPSHRKALPDFIRIPEEAMAVMLRRRNTGSSCQNTQGAVITASLPDTGTQNYNARVLTPVCSVAVPSEQHSHQTGRMALSSFSALWQWQGTSWGAQGTASGELRALGSELREILQSDTVTCFHGPKSVLILFAYF